MNLRSIVLGTTFAVSTAGLVFFLTRRSSEATVPSAGRLPASEDGSASRGAAAVLPELVVVPDAPLEEYRKSLLDLAQLAASAIPRMPHVKTRSREQEQVASAYLELGQMRLALELVETIDNWRRGTGYADLAYYCARKGHAAAVQPYLERARRHVEQMSLDVLIEEQGFDGDDEALEGYQAWRRDRIRAKIARTHVLLGREDAAIEFEEGLEPSEAGIVQVVRARTMPKQQVREAAERLDSVAAEANLELVRNALNVALELHERFYEDVAVRALLREKLEACLAKVPLLVQIDVLRVSAETALDRSDPDAALRFVERARATLASNPLAIEDELPLRARLAAVAHRAGATEQARAELEAVVRRFDAARDGLTDLLRPDVLIPVAEAYARMGDDDAALASYRRAAAEGAANPNAVPRAEDLVALCLSMARTGVEPDPELWRSIRETLAGLREPW